VGSIPIARSNFFIWLNGGLLLAGLMGQYCLRAAQVLLKLLMMSFATNPLNSNKPGRTPGGVLSVLDLGNSSPAAAAGLEGFRNGICAEIARGIGSDR
jgi:hypothetical protein